MGHALPDHKVSAFSAGPYPSPLHLFAGVLLLADASSREIDEAVAAARDEAHHRIEAGRAPVADRTTLEFETLYRALRTRAAAIKPLPSPASGVRWRRAIGGLAQLRHRQRAALTLHYCAALPLDDVASILALREPEARRVVEAGVAALLRALAEPLDVRRALRAAGVRLVAEPEWPFAVGPGPRPEGAPARMPRPVVRLLLAEPIPAEPTDSREEQILAPFQAQVPPTAAENAPEPPVAPAQPRAGAAARRHPRLRPMLAASLGILVVMTLAPARGGRVVPAPPPVPVEVSSSPIFYAPPLPATVTVRPGDSLWRIAERRTGNGTAWLDLWRANRGVRMAGGRRFTDPDLILPGWRLRLPARWARAPSG
jgi:nucleoid-associated protein YgaU